MLLQSHSGGDGCFQAMGLVSFHHFAERAHRSAFTFPVIRQRAEIALHLLGCPQAFNQFPFPVCESFLAGLARHAQS